MVSRRFAIALDFMYQAGEDRCMENKRRLLRVRRLVEYVGEPEAVLVQLARSARVGNMDLPHGRPTLRITISQLGSPEFVDGDNHVVVAAAEQAAPAALHYHDDGADGKCSPCLDPRCQAKE